MFVAHGVHLRGITLQNLTVPSTRDPVTWCRMQCCQHDSCKAFQVPPRGVLILVLPRGVLVLVLPRGCLGMNAISRLWRLLYHRRLLHVILRTSSLASIIDPRPDALCASHSSHVPSIDSSREDACIIHSLTHSHSLTHALSHIHSHSLTHPLTHSHTGRDAPYPHLPPQRCCCSAHGARTSGEFSVGGRGMDVRRVTSDRPLSISALLPHRIQRQHHGPRG